MTLRAHRISGSFNMAWRALMAANVHCLLGRLIRTGSHSSLTADRLSEA